MIKRKKGSKMKNTKVAYDGFMFDSIGEKNRYVELKLMEKSGMITDLTLQKPFILAPSVVLHGRKKPALKYKCDFFYINNQGEEVVEDAKSEYTRTLKEYRIKMHLMKWVHNIDVVEIIK